MVALKLESYLGNVEKNKTIIFHKISNGIHAEHYSSHCNGFDP